jgi:hypothetical protein
MNCWRWFVLVAIGSGLVITCTSAVILPAPAGCSISINLREGTTLCGARVRLVADDFCLELREFGREPSCYFAPFAAAPEGEYDLFVSRAGYQTRTLRYRHELSPDCKGGPYKIQLEPDPNATESDLEADAEAPSPHQDCLEQRIGPPADDAAATDAATSDAAIPDGSP